MENNLILSKLLHAPEGVIEIFDKVKKRRMGGDSINNHTFNYISYAS